MLRIWEAAANTSGFGFFSSDFFGNREMLLDDGQWGERAHVTRLQCPHAGNVEHIHLHDYGHGHLLGRLKRLEVCNQLRVRGFHVMEPKCVRPDSSSAVTAR